MTELAKKKYVVIVQCHIVKQRCPGYLCEKAFHERTGGFADYPKDRTFRVVNMTCGGCCGRGLHRKLTLLVRALKKKEGLDKADVVVQLSSCITKENFHAPVCPHLDYLRTLIERIGLDVQSDTVINETAQRRRDEGVYQS